MAKAIFSGQINLKSMLAGLLDNNYLYILKNLKVLNPFKSASNNQVLEMGKRIGGVVFDIAAALVGAAAAKVLSILKATKVGSKIASTLSKAKCKIKTKTIGKITKKTYCFAAGTPVLLVDGMKPIEEVRKGDWVWSTDQGSGELEEKQVEEVFVNETNEIVHVRYGDEDITATTTHPFYTPDRGWVKAVDLRAGDRLQLVNGEYVTVEQVQHEILESPITVYNFRVADNHTYYVGDGDDIVLVHNADCGFKTLAKKVELPTEGKIRFVPPDGTGKSLLKKNGGYVDKYGNIWVKGSSRTKGEAFEWDVQLSKKGKESIGWLSRDGKEFAPGFVRARIAI